MGRYLFAVWVVLILCVLSPNAATDLQAAEIVDNSLYADLLTKYVKDGVVNYQGFKKEEFVLDEYLNIIEKTQPGLLSHNGQFAFYINAYNAWTIKLVLGAYPGIHSIKEVGGLFGSPWKIKICRINGDVLSLDDIENKLLRPRFKDPRVHFAVNCASRSCPPLRSEPYDGTTLDQQLDDAAKGFINDPRFNRLEGRTLYVSEIFNWYRQDFGNNLVDFLFNYTVVDLHKRLAVDRGNIGIKYLPYDWSLNGE